MPAAPPGVPPPSRRDFRIGIVAILAFSALVVGGVVLFVTSRGQGFPDQLGGYDRNRSDAVREIEDALGSIEVMGVTMDVAVYGSDVNPAVILFTIEGVPSEFGDMGSDAFFSSFMEGFQGGYPGSGEFDPSSVVQRSVDGVDYFCAAMGVVSAAGAQPTAICVFRGEVVGMLMVTTTSSPATALRLSEEAYGSLA
jgi:hypothetical protein